MKASAVVIAGLVLLLSASVAAAGTYPDIVESYQKISATEGGFTGVLEYNDQFGHGLAASLGDLDGDGIGDLAVGAFRDDDGGDGRGAVWILFLNADGTVKSHQKISDTEGGFTGTLDDDDLFGMAVANIGDLDGDSVVDLAVGAGDDDGGFRRGAVWILFLNSDGTVKFHQKISDIEGGFDGVLDDNDNFAAAVCAIGDLDGDSVMDLAVGADRDDDGGYEHGAVWILFLNANGTVKSHQKISNTEGGFTGTLDDVDEFGSDIAALDDLDGDGVVDLAIGAPNPLFGPGKVFVLFLQADGTVKEHQEISASAGGFGGALDAGDQFGFGVAAMGDLDADGSTDLAAGARNDDDGGPDRGAVWILFLNSDGTVKSEQKVSDTEGGFSGGLEDTDWFGAGLELITDLDGNGDGDLTLVTGADGDDDGEPLAGAVWLLSLKGQIPELTLWNKLGSDAEVLNSEVGPDFEFWNPAVHPGTNCCDVAAQRTYVSAQHGSGMMPTGSYWSMARVHNLFLGNIEQVINPEEGCIELWYMQTAYPVPYVNGEYRLFDGSFGLSTPLKLSVNNPWSNYPHMIILNWWGSSSGNTWVWYNLDNVPLNQWVHVAGVWDRNGIEGSPETMRLYVDGVAVAATTANDWPASVAGTHADIGGGQDYIGEKFAIDNMMIWNVAKTDFSGRFTEAPTPLNEPPVLACNDPTAETDPGVCAAAVDCSAIATCTDPDGDALTLSCDPAGPYPVGATTVVVECSDGQETVVEACPLTVWDKEVPQIAAELIPSTLWPPNHRMVDVEASVSASDNCAVQAVALVSVTSNEPDNGEGDGNTVDDIQGADLGTPDFALRLRAERSGLGSGRLYTAVYTATDTSANSMSDAGHAFVPHDQGGMTDPIGLSLENTALGTVLHWSEVPDALAYDAIRGDLSHVTEEISVIDLGPVTCIEAASTDCCTDGYEDADLPGEGHVFFYLVAYDNGSSSSYGTEGTGKPRAPGPGDCE